jgi:PhnB protein
MSAIEQKNAIETGISPYLTCRDAAAAIDFYTKAFDAVEQMRMPCGDGRLLHASLSIAGSTLMLCEEFPEWGGQSPMALQGSPVSIHINVENVDEAFAKALDAGCEVTMPLEDTFWGDRFGGLKDPFGHRWTMSSQVREVSPEEMAEVASQIIPGAGDENCG